MYSRAVWLIIARFVDDTGFFMLDITAKIAEELGVAGRNVTAAVALLDEGATVPFIARYRKEVTGSLDDTQLRTLEERLRYLRELEERRTSILASIEEQGKLTAGLKNDILAADTKVRLEDLYLPYKKKRRTKGQIALEAGLSPAEKLKIVQTEMERGNPEAFKLYESIGVYFGYAIAYYALFYEIDHVLIMGRVTSGEGGTLLLDKAREVLKKDFPEIYTRSQLHIPDEKSRRVGQSVAAASLPEIQR